MKLQLLSHDPDSELPELSHDPNSRSPRSLKKFIPNHFNCVQHLGTKKNPRLRYKVVKKPTKSLRRVSREEEIGV
jgi:hypothetical protein